MVNPFDLKTVFLAKHAQHVVLIHFPIALFLAAVVFDYMAEWRKNQTLGSSRVLEVHGMGRHGAGLDDERWHSSVSGLRQRLRQRCQQRRRLQLCSDQRQSHRL